MNTDRILPVNREHLLLMQVLCWLGPGVKIFITGIKALQQVNLTNPDRVWWLSITALAVAIVFSLMFNNFVKRYTERILNCKERKKSLFAFFDLHGYILIFFMMGLGISLKFIPFIPIEFFAGFYPGLGTALTIAGVRYFISWCRA
jgi:membrane-associated HD superfamily phosphohydrolase